MEEYDTYLPILDKDFLSYKTEIKNLLYWIKNFKIKPFQFSSWLFKGSHGCGKTYMVNQILKNNNIEIKTLNFTNIKIELNKKNIKGDIDEFDNIDIKKTKKNKRVTDELEKNFKKIVTSIDISIFINPQSSLPEYKVVVIDEHEKANLNTWEKNIINELISINHDKHICPLIFIFNDRHDKFVNKIEKKAFTTIMTKPTNTEMTIFIDNLCKGQKIDIDKELVTDLVELSQHDYRKLKTNFIELVTLYGIENSLTKFSKSIIISKEKYKEFRTNKNIFSNEYNLYEISKSLFFSYTNINNILNIYNHEKTLIPLIFYQHYIKKIVLDRKTNNKKKYDIIKRISKAQTKGDILDNYIYNNQRWNLIKYHGFYSCCVPCYEINKINGINESKLQIYFPKDMNKTSIQKLNIKHISSAYDIFNIKQPMSYIYIIQLIIAYLDKYISDIEKKVGNSNEYFKNFLMMYKLNIDNIENIIKINKFNSNDIKLSAKHKKYLKKIFESL